MGHGLDQHPSGLRRELRVRVESQYILYPLQPGWIPDSQQVIQTGFTGQDFDGGFGPQAPSPDWAAQVSDNYQLLNDTAHQGNYWTVLFPGAAVASLIVGVNLIADAIARVLQR